MYKQIFILLGFVLSAASAWSHARLQSPVPRSNNAGIKSPAPCGPNPKAAVVPATNVYAQGQRIMLRFEETINHPGKYLFRLSTGNNDVFPVTPDLIVPDVQAGALPHQYMAELQLPAGFTCTNCTLQMIQSMEENPAVPSFYYSCADIRVGAPAGGAPTLGAIAAQTTAVNIPKSVVLTSTDPDGALTCTASNFSATSSNAAVLDVAGISFSGVWPNCFINMTPIADAIGTSNVGVTLTDGTTMVSQTFAFAITASGAPPPGPGPLTGITDGSAVAKPGFGCGIVSDYNSGSGPGANGGAMRWTLVLLMLPLIALSLLRQRSRVVVRSLRRK